MGVHKKTLRIDLRANPGMPLQTAILTNLRPEWRSSINLYNSMVKFVLLYGSECWQIVETVLNKSRKKILVK